MEENKSDLRYIFSHSYLVKNKKVEDALHSHKCSNSIIPEGGAVVKVKILWGIKLK